MNHLDRLLALFSGRSVFVCVFMYCGIDGVVYDDDDDDNEKMYKLFLWVHYFFFERARTYRLTRTRVQSILLPPPATHMHLASA